MLKQIIITSAVLIATMGQMVSSQSGIEVDFPNIILSAVNADSSFKNLDIKKGDNAAVSVNTTSRNASEDVAFYIGNRSSTTVTVNITSNEVGGPANLQYIVAPGGFATATIPSGSYNISGSAIGVQSYLFQLNCGYSMSGRLVSFDNVEVSMIGCAEIIIANN